MKRTLALALVAVVATAVHATAARAQLLRHCVRVDHLCWLCVDVMPPLGVSCPETAYCGPPSVCVTQGIPRCYSGVTRCCPPMAASCELVPGCAGAGSACGDVDGDGVNETCTSLSQCPGAVASEIVDGGVPPPGDAGALGVDAGVPAMGDAGDLRDDGGGTTEADGGIADAGRADGGRDRPDASSDMDSGPAPSTPPPSIGFEGGGGCACSAALAAHTPGALGGSCLVAGLLAIAGRGVRARRRRRARSGRPREQR